MADRTNEMRAALKEEDAQPQYRALLDTCSETAQPPSLLNRQLNLLQCRYVSGVRILRSCEDLIDDLDSALNRSFVERDVPSAAEDLIAKFLIALAAMHKHPGFSTEKEWRLVQIVKRSDGQSKMEARRGTERRYVEIELGLKYGQLSNVTKAWRFGERRPPRPLSIVLGPALNTAVVPNDVQAMIDSGILQLTQSKIPFLS